jgi:hypothetical protein
MNTIQQDLQELLGKNIALQNQLVELINNAEDIQEDILILIDEQTSSACTDYVKITEPRFLGFSEQFKINLPGPVKDVFWRFGSTKIPIVLNEVLMIPSLTNQALQDFINQVITTEFGKKGWTHNGVESICNLRSLEQAFDIDIAFVIYEPKFSNGDPLPGSKVGKPRIEWDYDADPYEDKAESDKLYDNRWYFGETCKGRFDEVMQLLPTLPAIDGFNLLRMDLDRNQTEVLAEVLLRDCKGFGYRADFRGGDLSDTTKQEFIDRGWQTVIT